MKKEEKMHAQPILEEIITVNISFENNPKIVQIGTNLSSQEVEKLTLLLKEFKDVCAWSYEDMPRIDLEIVQHKLPLFLNAKLVKQKLSHKGSDWVEKSKKKSSNR